MELVPVLKPTGVQIDQLVARMGPASLEDTESEDFKFSLAMAIIRSRQKDRVDAQKWKRKVGQEACLGYLHLISIT